MFEYTDRSSATPDALFLERLDAFMEKCLADIKAFADREFRPFEETRQYVAEWHSKYLFQPQPAPDMTAETQQQRTDKVRSILCDASRVLESLSETCGVQSFLLAVDPQDPGDAGFLGGSLAGREFWRGMRGGGESGARLFKAQCSQDLEAQRSRLSTQNVDRDQTPHKAAKQGQGQARILKHDLYESVRKALRTVSGIRNAEMKWTNPERLDAYGVRLVGWPLSIPAQNPSTLKASQNKVLLECLENGSMRFERIAMTGDTGPSDLADSRNIPTEEGDEADDFSWAYDIEGGLGQSAYEPSVFQNGPPDDSPVLGTVQTGNPQLSPKKRPRNDSDG